MIKWQFGRPRHWRTTVAIATGAALLGSTSPAAALPDPTGPARARPVLHGVVGPGFDIWISESSVTKGKYKLVVDDLSSIHNFHFFGPGVDHETSVPGTGTVTWRVRLRPGTYIILCVQHGSMRTTLEVTR